MASELELWPYSQTFNAIAAATEIKGGCIFISVKKFAEAFGPRPAPAATDTGLETVGYAHRGTIGLLLEGAVSKAVIVPNAGGDFKTPVMLVEQAEELLAAERAKVRHWQEQYTEMHSQFIDLAKSAEADNAAQDARINFLERLIKEQETQITNGVALEAKLAAAEAGRDRVRRIFRRNTRLRFEAEKRAEVIEAKFADAEKSAFEHGYVMACCNIVNLHDEPTIAHCTLSELGVTRAAVKAMDLSEYDLKALRKIERDRSRSPYAKASRKARAVLGGKP
ncbi:hypothetical protein DEA98_10520 [Brucella pseudogrignonensis]|uniref:Uncharacterized protein n=1 Tax=Brucella pseudogrignonensis TaxID=419475 RepID=A0A7Y3WYA3_9HYPH|nr:hypothetical protein [Brucella pseudogrignonensis]MCM0751593.1 hypothetical protein [Brucella pseudogrignonensis]MCM0751625.1 hypothetical protein [Brucella pseudogrignonensis]NNV22018.1 hypothetical protein [Brucella pseudogrignonensis]